MTAPPKWIRALGLAAAVALVSNTVHAQSWFTVFRQESPVVSAGTGSATFNITGNIFTITGSFSGLTGTTTVAHIHCCTATPGTGNAGVATTTPTFVGFPTGVTSGTFQLILDLTLTPTYSAAFLAANGGTTAGARAALINGMNSGTSYFNIHSSFAPGGEIRGTISVVPEPSSMLLMGTGLLAIAGVAVRRRRTT